MKTKVFLLNLALVCSANLFAHDFAVANEDGKIIYYNKLTYPKGEVSVTFRGDYYNSYREYSGSIVIPSIVTYMDETYRVTEIENRAFKDCSSLTSVTIGENVTSIDDNAFGGCSSLTSVIWNAKSCGSARYSSFGNQITSFTFGDSVEYIPAYLCSLLSNLTSVTIPNSVTSIGAYAFLGCTGLTSITIPDNVTSIGENAFTHCSGLTSITIPNSVIGIGNEAFSSCDNLISVTIGEGVQSMGVAFKYCPNLISVVWNAKSCCDFIDDDSRTQTPFYYSEDSKPSHGWYTTNQITSFTFGNSVEHIPAYLCLSMDLTSVTIPASVTSIGKGAFRCYSLTSMVWNAKKCEDFTSTNSLFYDSDDWANSYFIQHSQFTSMTFGDSVDYIPAYLCDRLKNLTSVTIPDSVKTIADYAFNQSGLKTVSIGSGIEDIGNYAFSGCDVTSILVNSTQPPTIYQYTFKNIFSTALVTVPCGSIGNYQEAEFWGNFDNYKEDIPYRFLVQSADTSQGTVTISQKPTCNDYNTSFYATPKTGYKFVNWSDGNTENPRTLQLTENTTLTASFAPINYTITVESKDATMGTVAGSGNYPYNSTQTITATANEGYYFVAWSDGNTNAERTITITGNATYTAEFAAICTDYTLTVESANSAQGSVVIIQDPSCENNNTAKFRAVPAQGYKFKSWNDGVKTNPRTEVLTEDATFVASFELINNALETPEIIDGIYTQDGGIYGADDLRIFNLVGQEVTHLNGALNNGVYLVKVGTKVQKVFVGR